MSIELMNHLKNVNNNSFIGFCIQQMLLRPEHELRGLLNELRTISIENPEILIPIIGKEAHAILTE
jgi:hypothetical protein